MVLKANTHIIASVVNTDKPKKTDFTRTTAVTISHYANFILNYKYKIISRSIKSLTNPEKL